MYEPDLNNRKLFLASNSTNHGQSFLEHCKDAMLEFLGPEVKMICFIPFAALSQDGDREYVWANYTDAVERVFKDAGVETLTAFRHEDPRGIAAHEAINKADAVFIGGGNTFHLLYYLYKWDLVSALQRKFAYGYPLMGSSAGTNVLCPTIMTTNDMPIVYPPSFNAVGAASFQINPHYLDPDPNSTYQGESREVRIKEFLAFNDRPVLGLREGSWLVLNEGKMTLHGTSGARLFYKDADPIEYVAGADLTALQSLSFGNAA